jgi:hypothetical protein
VNLEAGQPTEPGPLVGRAPKHILRLHSQKLGANKLSRLTIQKHKNSKVQKSVAAPDDNRHRAQHLALRQRSLCEAPCAPPTQCTAYICVSVKRTTCVRATARPADATRRLEKLGFSLEGVPVRSDFFRRFDPVTAGFLRWVFSATQQ